MRLWTVSFPLNGENYKILAKGWNKLNNSKNLKIIQGMDLKNLKLN